ncbi:hypothetical protein SAMN05660909_02223 [Chitinophaga terrae (ex Kim and Jung 2007)]|uniref:Lipoprotein n=1 Tax=Chitinophaga terrae (ex Kim and Jung 2007) TaxID=408074 RepID=A0A1H4BQJ6_9BACT|nr:hypothetical protein [Chitinophaga terrae (ex Kim and Jung 2007)]SEA50350.1 hypothetical protein SAMN05660909_02223 [Chitinophaga terrae (ex Kim and Jung 2007)]
MKKQLPIFLMQLSAAFFLLSSCVKEVPADYPLSLNPGPDFTVPDPANSAKYEFISVNGACSDAVVEGAYTVGKAADATNFIRVTVYVTRTGAWTMKTPVVNGVSFAGQGTFNDTGLQPVKLLASGTPVRAQTYNTTMTAANGNCSTTFTCEQP